VRHRDDVAVAFDEPRGSERDQIVGEKASIRVTQGAQPVDRVLEPPAGKVLSHVGGTTVSADTALDHDHIAAAQGKGFEFSCVEPHLLRLQLEHTVGLHIRRAHVVCQQVVAGVV
jgi:hypothetical protein